MKDQIIRTEFIALIIAMSATCLIISWAWLKLFKAYDDLTSLLNQIKKYIENK